MSELKTDAEQVLALSTPLLMRHCHCQQLHNEVRGSALRL